MLPSTSVKSPRPRKPCLLDRRMGVRVAQSQQSLPGDQDQDFPLINIVQEQLHRRIPTKIFRVFVLLFPALLETRDIPGNAPLQNARRCNDVEYMQDLSDGPRHAHNFAVSRIPHCTSNGALAKPTKSFHSNRR